MAEPETKKLEVEEEVEEIDADEEDDDDVEATGDGPNKAAITAQLMKNPEVLAALQDSLGGIIGQRSGYIQSLPKVVKRRIKSLKKLQFEMIKIESKFYEEVHELECKYAAQYAPLMERRRNIINADVEPTDSDCEWPSDEEEDDEDEKLAEEMEQKAKVTEINEKEDGEKNDKEEEKDENTKGIPQFWLTIFKSVDMLSDMVQEQDEPILQHLRDIKVNFSKADPMGFTLEFQFEENEFFTNTVLTKEYFMRSEPDEADPFSFEGPEIIKCKGCTVDWKKGKNVTVKVVKKTQKHKGRGTKRTVTKTVQADSFFNFFNPPEAAPEGEEQDEETESLLAADFEIGHFIRERVVPRAVLYFTGEALDEDDFDEEGEEEEGEDDDGEYDEDADPDFVPQAGQKPADCKQQ